MASDREMAIVIAKIVMNQGHSAVLDSLKKKATQPLRTRPDYGERVAGVSQQLETLLRQMQRDYKTGDPDIGGYLIDTNAETVYLHLVIPAQMKVIKDLWRAIDLSHEESVYVDELKWKDEDAVDDAWKDSKKMLANFLKDLEKSVDRLQKLIDKEDKSSPEFAAANKATGMGMGQIEAALRLLKDLYRKDWGIN